MEQAEFEHIATSVRQRAFATALAFTGDRDKAEDIAQETMLKLWTLRSKINGLAHIEKLASCIAHNRAIDSHRQQAAMSLDCGRSVIDDKAVSPDRAIEDKETLAWLENCLAGQVERKSHEEIAQIVGVRKSSVSTILSRARVKMLNEFKKRTR